MDRPCTGTRSGPSPCASGPGAPYLGLPQPAYANFAPQFPHSSAVDSRRSSHSGHLNMPPSIFFRICARMIRTARSRKLLGCWARSRITGSTSKPFSRHASIWRVYSSSSVASGPGRIPSIALRISRRTASGIDWKSGSSERTSSEPRTPARVFSMYACSASGPRAAPHAGHVVSDSGTTARHARHRVRSCRFGAAGATLCRRILREIVWWRPRRTADSGSASLITSAKSRKPRSVRRRAVRWSIPGTRANAFTASSSASSRSLLTPAPHASHTAIRLENIFPHFGQIAWPGRRIVAHRGHTAASDAKPQTGHFPGIGPVHPGPAYLTVPPRLSRTCTFGHLPRKGRWTRSAPDSSPTYGVLVGIPCGPRHHGSGRRAGGPLPLPVPRPAGGPGRVPRGRGRRDRGGEAPPRACADGRREDRRGPHRRARGRPPPREARPLPHVEAEPALDRDRDGPADAAARIAVQKALHVRELVDAARGCGTCPHKAALEAAKKAHVVVCDYNYVFSDIRERVLPRMDRPLEDIVLVVDEAHNLPDRIRSHLTGDLDAPLLIRAAKEARSADPETGGQLQGVARSVHQALLGIEGERTVERDALVEAVEKGLMGGDFGDLVRAVTEAGASLAGRGIPTVLPDVAEFLRRWRDVKEGILRMAVGGAGGRFAIRVLDPAVLSRDVFAAVHGSLLMSGTLHPPAMYADLLGIPPERRVLRAYPNPFPRENRAILVSPGTTTAYDRRSPSMYARIAEEIAGIAEETPGNLPPLFPSYEILGAVAERLAHAPVPKRRLAERQGWTAAQRADAIETLRRVRGTTGGLLLGVQGGSLSEGVDYADNLLSTVVIVGLPLSPPSLEAEALRSYYIRKFGPEKGHEYAVVYPAVSKVLQAAGRCIRSERDRAAIVLLEARLLETRYARCFPADFPLAATRDVANGVRTFFYGARASAAGCS